MKKLQIFILSFLILSACNTQNTEVLIHGHVTGQNPGEVLFSLPVYGNYNGWFKSSVNPDSSGNFTISQKLDQPSIMLLVYNSGAKHLILEPGETYEIDIDVESGQMNFQTPRSEAQKLFDSLPHSRSDIMGYLQKDLSDYSQLFTDLDGDLDSELQQLKQIKCSDQVRSLMKTDRQVFYRYVKAKLASIINVMSLGRKEQTPEEVMKVWSKAVSDLFSSKAETSKAIYFFDLLQMAQWYRVFTELNYDEFSKERKEKRDKGLTHTHTIQMAKRFLPDEYLEFFSATYLQSKTAQKKYEKELISLFENFKTDYPDSKYTKYLAPEISEIAGFYKKLAGEGKTKFKFVEDYENIESLADCMSRFSGKKVFVDIWSTSCGSCKKEFEHHESLKKVLKNKDTEMLYISLDRENTSERWKDMIKFYGLEGYHVRASESLKSDLRSILGRFAIPRYLIIDQKGEIVNDNAPRAYNLKELEQQL